MIFLIKIMETTNSGRKVYTWHETHGGSYKTLHRRLRTLSAEHPLNEFRAFKLSSDGTETLINI